MKKVIGTLIVALGLLLPLQISHAQQAEAPVYKDGDWWRVKVEIETRAGLSRAGVCHEQYPEYLIVMEQSQPVVYWVSGNEKTRVDCPLITGYLLNIPSEHEYLKFPLTINATWTTKQFYTAPGGRSGRWLNWETKVQSLEKVRTEKRELQAFKIERAIPQATATYFYSPQAKAIVLYESVDPFRTTKRILIDFNVQP